MNINDLSYDARLIQQLGIAKGVLRAASLKKGQKPVTRPSRQQLIRDQYMYQPRAGTPDINLSQIHISYIAHRFPPSVTPISALKKTYINDLLLETNHRGSYILLRTIAPPTRMTAVMSAVEDEKGGCEFVQLYNMNTKRDRRKILPEGQILIIKEPFYKSNATGGTGIRVDHVSDVIFLSPGDSLIPMKWQPRVQSLDKTAMDWKEEGNALFRRKEYYEAIECYTQGLKMDVEDTALVKTLRLNRSQTYLSIGFYDKALEDSEHVLLLDPTDEKALFRAARALYLARKFKDCKTRLTTLIKNYPANKDAKANLLKAYQRLQEERTGKYNLQEMRALTTNGKRPAKLDCADYVGPVQLQNTIGSGRGLFTTRDVKFGELLLCSKAFVICYPETDGESFIIDVMTDRMEKSSGSQVVTKVVQKLYNNPSASKEFLELYSGPYERVKEKYIDERPVVDTFLAHEIRRFNAFGFLLLSDTSKHISLAGEDLNNETGTQGIGIWTTPSFINHACWGPGTVHPSFMGDMMFVRATMDMKKGEQITFSYLMLNQDIAIRQKSFTGGWGFTCSCCYCTAESQDTPDVRKSRRTQLKRALSFGKTPVQPSALPQIVKVVKFLEATYKRPPSEQPRIVLAGALEHLSWTYQQLGDPYMLIKTVQHMLEAVGYKIEISPGRDKVSILQYGLHSDYSELLTQVSLNYSHFGNSQLAKSYLELAANFHEVSFGERVSFSERFGKVFGDAGLKVV